MKQRTTQVVAALVLLAVGLACQDRATTEPGIKALTPVLRSVTALPAASATLGAVPGQQVALPNYVDPILASVTISGLTYMTSHDSSYYVTYAGPVDGAGIHNSTGNAQCSMSAQISYPLPGRVGLGGSGAGVCTNPPQSRDSWTGIMILQGAGSALRGGGVLEPEYQCGAAPCHTYSGEQTFIVQPLGVEINTLTPGSQVVGPKTIMVPQPGIWTLFIASATPDTISGFQVPVKATSWQWIPDVAPGTSTVPCTNLNLCSAYINEPGRMVLTAQVNGVEQVDIVTVVRGRVKIVPDQPTMKGTIILDGPLYFYRHEISKQFISVSVVDANGAVIPFSSVDLTQTPTENTAGHLHIGNKPVGLLDSVTSKTVNTGLTGIRKVEFQAPEVSGPVTITGESSGAATDSASIDIGIFGLQLLSAGPGYALEGDNGWHPDNHWVTGDHKAKLQMLAALYSIRWPAGLRYNDSSLPRGGLFDWDVEHTPWTTPHGGHREGQNTDLKIIADAAIGYHALTPGQKAVVRVIWIDSLKQAIGIEGNHYHLRPRRADEK